MIKVNEYFDGAVKSLAFETPAGKFTSGVMEEGEYEFGTSAHETMTVIEGRLAALLPEEEDWKVFDKGQSFEVPAGVKFRVKVSGQAAYLCMYE